jgi:hypothetical protein
VRCQEDQDNCIVCGKGGCILYNGIATGNDRPLLFRFHFYHKKYDFQIFMSDLSTEKAVNFKDLIIDATIILQTTYFITVEDIVGNNSAGLLRFNWAETSKEKNCHTRWSPRLPLFVEIVRNRPSGVPDYYLEHVRNTRNVLVSSGFHGMMWVVDITNLSKQVSVIKATP